MKSKRAPDSYNNLKPVEKIELSEKHIKLRIVLVVLFIVLALAAFAVGIIFLLSTDKGWTEVEASASDSNCSTDFIFYYEIQEGGLKGTEEYRAVSASYGTAAINAYRIFNEREQFEGVYNLAYINENINETIEIDPSLYSALELLNSYGSRFIYLAPVYSYYYNIFYASDQDTAEYYDPYKNGEMAEYYLRLAGFANDSESINLELLGNNMVRLTVSEEYQSFAEDNGIDCYLDLFTLKNAFITDYMADHLISEGFSCGLLTSYDGYTRTLGADQTFNMEIFDKKGQYAYIAGSVSGTGEISAVRFRNYSLGTSDYGYKFGYSDGTAVTNYVDPADGKYKSCINDLVSYAYNTGCAELMLNVLPLYLSDTFDEAAISALKAEKSVYSIYCLDNELVYNDSDLTVTVTSSADVAYTKRYTD